jgi:hypothetical protein
MSQTKDDEIDMSPRAVALRLDEVRDLFRLTQYLMRFRPVEEQAPRTSSSERQRPTND